MTSEVYFAQRRATQGGGLLEKLEQLCDAAGFSQLMGAGDVVAVKVPFGEVGNTTHLRQQYLQRIVRRVKHYGGRPFLTDTVPAAPSPRENAVDTLLAAAQHGFVMSTVDAPILIADGLRGQDEVRLPAKGQHLQEARIASAIAQADTVISVCHFTGHLPTGFAGAMWNLGVGGASRAGKAEILAGAAVLADDVAGSQDPLQERLVESLGAVLTAKARRVGFVNLLIDLTPEYDDQPWSDAAIAPDIGILASRDPIALDQASLDLLNQAPGIPGTRLTDPAAKDKLRDLYPNTDWELQLRYAESLGLGTRDYELMII